MNAHAYKDQYNISAEKVFQSNFRSLSSLLLEDCNSSMTSVNHTNLNFNEIISLLRGTINRLSKKYDNLRVKCQALATELKRVAPQHPLIKEVWNKDDIDLDLGVLGQKIRTFRPMLVNPLNSFVTKFVNSTIPITSSAKLRYKNRPANDPRDVKTEQQMVESFIGKHLMKFLVEDKDFTQNLPKKIVLNLYHRWCKAKGHATKVQERIVKMQITNQLKRLFPRLDHTDSNYRGIIFKADSINGSKVQKQQKNGHTNKIQDNNGNHKEKNKSDKFQAGKFKIEEQEQPEVDLDKMVEWSQQIRRCPIKVIPAQATEKSDNNIDDYDYVQELADDMLSGKDMIAEDWTALALDDDGSDLESDYSNQFKKR